MRDRLTILMAVAAVAIILFGEAYIYSFDRASTYDIYSERTPDGLEVSISSDISNEYDIIVLDNGGFPPASEYIIYYDAGYGESLEDAWHATGGRELDQEFYVSQLELQLRNMGIETVVMDASELGQSMQGWIDGDDCDQAVIVVSGALPDTVYTGSAGDRILQWLDSGGRLYWAGNLLGAYVSSEGSVTEVGSDYQMLFFGTHCLNESALSGNNIVNEEILDALSLSGNDLTFGVDSTDLPESLSVGYTDGRYSSMTLVRHGDGILCILGGVYSNDQRSDLVKAVASGISYCSKVLDIAHGSVTRGTEHVTLESSSEGFVSVFAYLGGYFPVYGERMDLPWPEVALTSSQQGTSRSSPHHTSWRRSWR